MNIGDEKTNHETGLGSVLLAGPDAREFLQGQLSCDMQTLARDNVLLASCNSAQGRVQAVCRIIERSDGVLLLAPRTIVAGLVARLRKYVLRAKVSVAVGPSVAPIDASEVATPTTAHVQVDAVSVVVLPGHGQVLQIGAGTAATLAAERLWHLEEIRAGQPNIYPPTSEAFVAQMLNLDLLGGISFEKGCYTGQEIIARTHYRGAIKRRMFRFGAAGPAPLPGARIMSGEQHAGDVVDAIDTAEGCEILAVISLAQSHERLTLADRTDAVLEPLALPYVVEGRE